MHYREAKSCEVEQIAQLHNELVYYIQKETQDEYWDFERLETVGISAYLTSIIGYEEAVLLVAVEGEKVVGFLIGEIMACHLPVSSLKQVGCIAAVYVVPEYRGQGIMKKLEEQALEFFKKKDLKYVELYFISNNTVAKKSWEGMGYHTFREQARKCIN